MADRRPYVRHGATGSPFAALAGVLLAAGILAGIAWGLVRTVGGEEPPPPPPPPTETAPSKPVLRIVFPEGFTREEMAKRIEEMNKPADAAASK